MAVKDSLEIYSADSKFIDLFGEIFVCIAIKYDLMRYKKVKDVKNRNTSET